MHSRCLTLTVLAALLFGPLLTNGAELLRDPTRPYSARPYVPAHVTTFNVTAILVSQKRRVAIVNGRRVIEGDNVDGAIVIEILRDRLRLDFHGKEITTRLLPDGMRE